MDQTSKGSPTSTELERLVISDGAQAYNQHRHRQTELGNETLIVPVQRLLRVSTERLAEAVRDWLAWIASRNRQPHAAYPLIEACGPELGAHYACQTVLDELSKVRHYSTVAREIGRRIEDELRIRCIRENDYPAWQRLCIFGSRWRRGRADDVRRAGRATVRVRGIPWGGWSHEKHVQVGVVLLELLIRSTGLVTSETREQYNPGFRNFHLRRHLIPAPETIEWLELAHRRTERLTLRHRAVSEPPELWSDDLQGGGYRLAELSYRLVKEPRGGWERRAPAVAAAANALQSTAWRVNRRVLRVAQVAWDRGIEVDGVPPGGALPKPQYPGQEDEKRERAWRREMAALYRADERRLSQRLRAARVIEQAASNAELERFYFPQRADFRGRMYPRAGRSGWTGGDLPRGLLEFAEPVAWEGGDGREARWLASHLAARWGLSRASYETRIRWAQKNRGEILAVASAPLEHLGFWASASDPWELLAGCFAWSDLELGRGDGHLRLPVSVDASANGLQIYALLTRDLELAERVNVTPSDSPSDVYSRIANATTEALACEEDDELAGWAATWLDMLGGAVTRKLAKQAAMSLVYGAEILRLRTDLVAWYEDQVRRDFGGGYWRPVCYLADQLAGAARLIAPRAFEVVRWFRDTGRALAKAGVAPTWTSPSGFYVVLDRRRQQDVSILTAVGEAVRCVSALTETEALSSHAIARAFAPNYVHSLDAAALHLSVARLAGAGVRSIATAHDAFAVPCAQVGQLHAELRRVYVELFTPDRLGELIAGIGEPELVPPMPAFGELDPSVVARSPYLFS